jgi:hypothetical protein
LTVEVASKDRVWGGGCYGVDHNISLCSNGLGWQVGVYNCFVGMLKPVGGRNCGIGQVKRMSNLKCARGLSSLVWRRVGDWAISYDCCDRHVCIPTVSANCLWYIIGIKIKNMTLLIQKFNRI